jgi:hypothetical protein
MRTVPASKIRRADLLCAEQSSGRALGDDSAGFEHISPVSDGQSHLSVLLDKKDRCSACFDLRDDFINLLHDERRKP